LNAFPPNDLHCFLKLNVGDWLALRSLMDAATEACSQESLPPAAVVAAEMSPSWHHADRGELRITWLEPTQEQDCGGLTITAPDGSSQKLFFRWDGTILMNEISGHWTLRGDGCLDLEIREEERIIKERIWFSKPNLRLRSTLEQFSDGTPGRASFSSEIRRVSPPQRAS
jgi:hypothetical protein